MKTSSNGTIFRGTIFQALCAENSLVIGEFPSQRPRERSFDVFFDLRQNKRLSKRLRRRWFETPLLPLWRHCNGKVHIRKFGRYPTALIHTKPCGYHIKLFAYHVTLWHPWLRQTGLHQDGCKCRGQLGIRPSATTMLSISQHIKSRCSQPTSNIAERSGNRQPFSIFVIGGLSSHSDNVPWLGAYYTCRGRKYISCYVNISASVYFISTLRMQWCVTQVQGLKMLRINTHGVYYAI